jgi:hypothetical protein
MKRIPKYAFIVLAVLLAALLVFACNPGVGGNPGDGDGNDSSNSSGDGSGSGDGNGSGDGSGSGNNNNGNNNNGNNNNGNNNNGNNNNNNGEYSTEFAALLENLDTDWPDLSDFGPAADGFTSTSLPSPAEYKGYTTVTDDDGDDAGLALIWVNGTRGNFDTLKGILDELLGGYGEEEEDDDYVTYSVSYGEIGAIIQYAKNEFSDPETEITFPAGFISLYIGTSVGSGLNPEWPTYAVLSPFGQAASVFGPDPSLSPAEYQGYYAEPDGSYVVLVWVNGTQADFHNTLKGKLEELVGTSSIGSFGGGAVVTYDGYYGGGTYYAEIQYAENGYSEFDLPAGYIQLYIESSN